MERIVVVDSAEWMKSSQQAHKWAFGEVRAPEMDRIDFVMLNVRDDKVLNYCTVRETDSESVYWQHGGASPDTKGTICLLYASPSPRDQRGSRMPSSA